MQASFRLSLPRDEASVPLTRRLVAQALAVAGVADDTISDVEIALSEACANVLRHAQAGDAYEVRAGFDDQSAFLEIIDEGKGFDPEALQAAADGQESGRGVALMRALMDGVRFETRDDDGSRVYLEKRLQWRPGAPAEKLRSVVEGASG